MTRRRTTDNAAGKPGKARRESSAGRFAYDGLDRVLHEKARLGILASLAANAEGLLFNDLKQVCSLTDGNLSRHLGVLSDAGLVDIRKDAAGLRPQTMCRLTAGGRRRFAEYISVLERVVADAQSEMKSEANRRPSSVKWSLA